LKEGGGMTYADAIAKRIAQICRARRMTLNKLATGWIYR